MAHLHSAALAGTRCCAFFGRGRTASVYSLLSSPLRPSSCLPGERPISKSTQHPVVTPRGTNGFGHCPRGANCRAAGRKTNASPAYRLSTILYAWLPSRSGRNHRYHPTVDDSSMTCRDTVCRAILQPGESRLSTAQATGVSRFDCVWVDPVFATAAVSDFLHNCKTGT